MKLELIHGRDYFSPSQLKKLHRSLGQLNAYMNKQFTRTSAMDLGTAVHCRILEPDEFDNRFVVMDNVDILEEIGGAKPTSTKVYKEWLGKYLLENKNKTILSKDDMFKVDKIYNNCAMTGIIDTFFVDGEAEKTITGTACNYQDEFDALCIVDYDTDFASIDLKTTSKPLHKFKWDADELGYDIQASLTNSLNSKEFVFVVVQTVEPYDIGVFSCSDYFMNRGKDKINQALSNYSGYKDEYSTQVLNFEL